MFFLKSEKKRKICIIEHWVTVFGKLFHTHCASVYRAAKLIAALLRPSGKKWQLTTALFMTHVTCKLTAKNRDQLRDHRPTLGNRIGGLRATFTFNVNPEYKNKTHNSV